MELKRDDIINYFVVIKGNYPNAFSGMTNTQKHALIDLWYGAMSEYEKEVCDRAIVNVLKKSERQPVLATVMNELKHIRNAYEVSEIELWAELESVLPQVLDEVGRFGMTYAPDGIHTQDQIAREEINRLYAELSSEIKMYVRSTSALIELALADDDRLSYEKGRFLKNMPDLRERAQTRKETPEIAELINGLAKEKLIAGAK